MCSKEYNSKELKAHYYPELFEVHVFPFMKKIHVHSKKWGKYKKM